MERMEAFACVIQTLRSRLSDEPLPLFGTPAHDVLQEALRVAIEQPHSDHLGDLGAATLRLLHGNYLASLNAERAALVAEIAARRGSEPQSAAPGK